MSRHAAPAGRGRGLLARAPVSGRSGAHRRRRGHRAGRRRAARARRWRRTGGLRSRGRRSTTAPPTGSRAGSARADPFSRWARRARPGATALGTGAELLRAERRRRRHRGRLRRSLPLRDARLRRAALAHARAGAALRSPPQRAPAGEAAALVLMTRDDGRGGPRLGRLLGHASASDGSHISAPDPNGRGLEFAVRAALDEAAMTADDVDVRERARNRHAAERPDRGRGAPAHARSSRVADSGQLDQGRARPLDGRGRHARGSHVPPRPRATASCRHGRSRGARSGLRPRSRASGSPRAVRPRVSLSTSLGFGGCNAALVLEGASGMSVAAGGRLGAHRLGPGHGRATRGRARGRRRAAR